MIRGIFVALSLVPVWWRRRPHTGRILRNRRGGSLILAGDVTANLSDALRAFVHRLPDGALYAVDRRGRFLGAWYRPPRRTR